MAQPTWPIPPKPQRPRPRWGMTLGILAVLVALGAGFYGGYQFFTHKTDLTNLISGKRSNKPNVASTQQIQGYVTPSLANAQDAGALNADQQLQLSITMPLSNQAKLKSLLANQYTPGSPFYHRFLTPDQFRQDYGPSPYVVAQVKDLLVKSGLKVLNSPNWQFLNIQASVGTIEQVFHVQLHTFTVTNTDGSKNTFYGPVGTPTVDSSLAGLIQNVSGLDNFSVYQTGLANASFAGYKPADLQKAYGADTLLSQGIDGTGQTIAFFELADFKDSDITTFQKNNNVTGGTFTRVCVDIPTGTATGCSTPNSGSIEVELDMEVAFGIAPKANQLVYIGPNSTQGLNDIYSQIVNDNKTKIVSTSWGLCESATGQAELNTLDQIFQQGAAQGIAFFAAAGDSGAYDCGNATLAVDSPADDPYVTGVGGTTLTHNADGSYSETPWKCTTSSCKRRGSQGAGGGGGVSAFFPQPTYQQGLNPPGVTTAMRFVPDISADADPNTGYAIYCTVLRAQCTGTIVVGGTSAAAPLWAAGSALISQYLVQQPQPATLGNLNPGLYSTAKSQATVFHDVTSGDNLHYNAGPGYDLATGIGTPDFASLATVLSGNPSPPPTGTPTPTPTPGTSPPTATPVTGTPTATPVPPPPGTGTDLIANGGFENGQNPWVESSSGGYSQLIDNFFPHSGTSSADLCAYANCTDQISQVFQVPSSFSSLTLTYFWDIRSQKITSNCVDALSVAIFTVNADGSLGNRVAQVNHRCNTDRKGSYTQQTVDLTTALQSYAGQSLVLMFTGQTDGNSLLRSEFLIDDVSLQAA